jgi:hypothetical protein
LRDDQDKKLIVAARQFLRILIVALHPLAPNAIERVALEVETLFARRHAHVSDQHRCFPLSHQSTQIRV